MSGWAILRKWFGSRRLDRNATTGSADPFEAARACEKAGRLIEAIAEYGRLADQGVATTDALISKALLQRQLGEANAAISTLRRAEANDLANPLPLMRLGEIAKDLGRPIACAHDMQAAVRKALHYEGQRFDVEMRVCLTAAYIRLERLDLAYAVARTLPDNLTDWWASTKHEGLTRRGEALKAVRGLLQGRRQGVDLSDDARLTLARKLLSLGRVNAAVALCDELIGRHPEWDLLVYFKTDVLTRQFGPQHALAFLRSNARLPRGSKEFMGSELRLLQEVEAWQEILDRMAADHEAEQFPHARRAVMIAMLVLDRRAELNRYCLDWMQQSPEDIAPAACIAFLYARTNGLSDRSGDRQPAAARTSVHVVQFWNGEAVPADVRHGMDSWRRLNPHWRHTVFDQAGAQAFLKERLGSTAADAFSTCWHPAMMADFFRVGFLLANGGLYADADEVCLRPLDGALPNLDDVEILAPLSGEVPGFVDNSFIGARAGSRILQLVLDDMIPGILSDAEAGRRSAVWVVTGPGALTRGVARYIGDKGADAGGMFFLPNQQHRTFARTETDLAYKRDPAANWRIA